MSIISLEEELAQSTSEKEQLRQRLENALSENATLRTQLEEQKQFIQKIDTQVVGIQLMVKNHEAKSVIRAACAQEDDEIDALDCAEIVDDTGIINSTSAAEKANPVTSVSTIEAIDKPCGITVIELDGDDLIESAEHDDTLSKANENKAVSVFPAKVEIDASNRLKRRISMSGPVTSSPIAKMVRTRSQIRLVEDDDKVRIENENVQMMSRQRRIFVGQSANSPKFVVTNNRFPKDEQMTDEMESKTAAANTRGPNVKGRRSITMSAIV